MLSYRGLCLGFIMLWRGRVVLCFGVTWWGLCLCLDYVMVVCWNMLWFCVTPIVNPPKRQDKNSFEVLF